MPGPAAVPAREATAEGMTRFSGLEWPTVRISPRTPAAVVSCRDATLTWTCPGGAAPGTDAAQTGRPPARTAPGPAPAAGLASAPAAPVPAALDSVTLAVPAAGHEVTGACHDRMSGVFARVPCTT